ncbi:MAG: TIGR03943 family protein [Chloroflexi bacterium]|nr:TIGR03943 family protein [Chloroflexota bacterium]MCI0578508.1 TIGR03943 family protein [Chloroflexota bacterium]MCI0648475.1 TIGR03943 family protein [Chloroflexota bacterium]MCI0725999.1 TIGR03943 family protein [Chloroflexota bacterium]
MQRLLKFLVLLATGLFLYTRLLNGTIYYYINQRFVVLVLLASAGFLLVAASYYRSAGQEADHAGHDHGRLNWLGFLLVLLPLVLGWLVPPQPLGASAVGNREVNVGSLSSVAPPRNDDRMGLVAGEKNILDWLHAIQQTSDPSALAGQEVHVIGFVYRDDRFAANQFLVGRFIVSCCVADASPVGLIVEWPDAASLPADQWLEVTGRFTVGTFSGVTLPILTPDEVKRIEPPAQPYLYG